MDNRCKDCGGPAAPGKPSEVDAVGSVYEGGDRSAGNVRVRRRRCHLAKTKLDASRMRRR